MERRLAEIPTEEWNDVRVDITPREYVLDYLAHSFPVQLYEPFTDSEGNLSSRPVFRDGQPVESREAVARRDALIEKLASLPPVPGALDQIVQRFGTDLVAEVTGRSRRIVRKGERRGSTALSSRTAPASANLAETPAFMDDQKRILVFSDAGGTGRSYHADLSARNQRLRVHYLLEPGWKADAAIQGLGPHQPHQPGAAAAVPADRHGREGREAVPLDHRPPPRHAGRDHARPAPDRRPGPVPARGQSGIATTPATRCASSTCCWCAARSRAARSRRFEDATGLKLMDANGIKDDLPPITTFLNRLLALTIELQGVLFTAFEQLLERQDRGRHRRRRL